MCGAFEHIGDGFDAAVRVHGEATDRPFDGIVEGEMVEEQEGIELVADARRDRAAELDARTFNGVLRFNDLGDRSELVHECMDDVGEEGITSPIAAILRKRPLT